MPRKSVEERFRSKHLDGDGCWEWIASKTEKGYGRFCLDGKAERAHRVAIILEGSDIPSGMHVLHSCDNPSCVNPDHLFLGDNSANMNDRDSKGRQPRGERNGVARLTDRQVSEIKSQYTGKYGEQKTLAERYGVHSSTIGSIVREINWRHIDE